MRVITKKTLVHFWQQHPEAKQPLNHWYELVSKAEWENSADVYSMFRTVDQPIINNRRVAIFNVGGNKYRIIVSIHFDKKKVFIRDVLTHAEYSTNRWKENI